MSSDGNASGPSAMLQEILSSLNSMRQEQSQLATAVELLNTRVNALAGPKPSQHGIPHDASSTSPQIGSVSPQLPPRGHVSRASASSADGLSKPLNGSSDSTSSQRKSSVTSKIILTSYPGQAGVDPLPMRWGEEDPHKRGRKFS